MKIAIIVGHDPSEQGAYSKALSSSEYKYNCEAAQYLKDIADIYYRPTGRSYKAKMEQLAKEINPKGYDLVIELHFNSFNGIANGCETVGFKGSALAERIGKLYCDTISKHYNCTNRGHKATVPEGRGYHFTKLMRAPALILEPFFGDTIEALKFSSTEEYACVLRGWLEACAKLQLSSL